MKTCLTAAVVLLIPILAGCTALPTTSVLPVTPAPLATATDAPSTPAEVVVSAAERMSAGDLDAGMALWADDAVWYIFGLPPNGSEMIKGKENIREEFVNEIAGHLKWEVDVRSVTGNVVTTYDKTWLDFTRQAGVAPVEATGQYLVEDGKIATYAWTIAAESLARLKAALAEAGPADVAETAAPAAAASAPRTPVSRLKVTVEGGTCRIDEPEVVQAGEVQVTVDVKDEDRAGYAVVFLTLEPGKDFADLMAASTGAPPSWADALHYEEVRPASTRTYGIEVSDGPLYGICFSKPPDHPIGNLGPLEVRQ